MFGISGEHLIILGVVLLIFGPRRLPELGHTMGKAIRNFKDSLAGVEEAAFRRVDDEEKGEKSPTEGALPREKTQTAESEPSASEESKPEAKG